MCVCVVLVCVWVGVVYQCNELSLPYLKQKCISQYPHETEIPRSQKTKSFASSFSENSDSWRAFCVRCGNGLFWEVVGKSVTIIPSQKSFTVSPVHHKCVWYFSNDPLRIVNRSERQQTAEKGENVWCLPEFSICEMKKGSSVDGEAPYHLHQSSVSDIVFDIIPFLKDYWGPHFV